MPVRGPRLCSLGPRLAAVVVQVDPDRVRTASAAGGSDTLPGVTDRTLTEQAVAPLSQRARVPPRLGALIVASAADLELRAIEIPRATTFGREAEADVVLPEPGISRVHLAIEPRDDGLWVKDLGSRNGTFVAGRRLGPDAELARAGTVLRLGKTLIVVGNVAPYAEPRPPPLPGLLGGAALDDTRRRVESMAASRAPVLVLGETGTGKEVIAHALHQQSGRRGSLVALNCAALPSELVDAELFGHTKGAFSGAAGSRAGQFRAADGGTLFLDEIAEMPPTAQAKLLRALETQEIRAVGDDHTVKVDVRIVAATNQSLEAMIGAGSFRADLLHRLAGFRLLLPPLRERREDVPALAAHFLAGSGVGLSTLALERMLEHDWPGNVRELRNAVLSAAHVAERRGQTELDAETMEEFLRPIVAPRQETEAEAELRRVTEALSSARGDVARAAEVLGTSRSVLYETLRRLGIEPRSYRKR